jgi:hypothetical protein
MRHGFNNAFFSKGIGLFSRFDLPDAFRFARRTVRSPEEGPGG